MERFFDPKPLSEMTLEELWQLFPVILAEHDPAWQNDYETSRICRRCPAVNR